MENLLQCSKTLYDHDLSEKTKQLRKYQLKMQINNWQEWENKVTKMFINLKNKLDDIIDEISELFNYDTMAIDNVVNCNIIYIIKNCLYSLTKNKEWSEHMAYFHFGLGIEGFLHGLMNTIDINDIFEPQDIINMIYKNIKYQLQYDKDPCILSPDYIILEFKCSKCKNISDYVNDNNHCFNCENDEII